MTATTCLPDPSKPRYTGFDPSPRRIVMVSSCLFFRGPRGDAATEKVGPGRNFEPLPPPFGMPIGARSKAHRDLFKKADRCPRAPNRDRRISLREDPNIYGKAFDAGLPQVGAWPLSFFLGSRPALLHSRPYFRVCVLVAVFLSTETSL